MKILFYAPMKPPGHPHPSGDLTIATGLMRFLRSRGHEVRVASRLRSRDALLRPWAWPGVLAEQARVRRALAASRPDIWLTYHTYYKAPDLLGPYVVKNACPYVIFQGAYSTKVRRRLATAPGFYANRHALLRAGHVFENRLLDEANVLRLLPRERVGYVAPGIFPADFSFSEEFRAALRAAWGVGDKPLVLTAAMFRPGVKAEGLRLTIQACGMLVREGLDLVLAVAGDGEAREEIAALAARELPGSHRFLGKVPREEMFKAYSAADLFAFPGIRESLGMVFLEAQSCGRPVVAFENGGVPEVVFKGRTGLLTPLGDPGAFARAIGSLCRDASLRGRMGEAAAARVRQCHDLERNYRGMEQKLMEIARAWKAARGK